MGVADGHGGVVAFRPQTFQLRLPSDRSPDRPHPLSSIQLVTSPGWSRSSR